MFNNIYYAEKEELLCKIELIKLIKKNNTNLSKFLIQCFDKGIINNKSNFKVLKNILLYIKKISEKITSPKMKLLIQILNELSLDTYSSLSSLLNSLKCLAKILTLNNKYSLKYLLFLIEKNDLNKLYNIKNDIVFKNKMGKYKLKKLEKKKICRLTQYLKSQKRGYEILPVLEQCIELLNQPLYFKYKYFFWNTIDKVIDSHYKIVDFFYILKSFCYMESLNFFNTKEDLFMFWDKKLKSMHWCSNLDECTYDLFTESNFKDFCTVYPVTRESAEENGYIYLYDYYDEDDEDFKVDFELDVVDIELKVCHPILIEYLKHYHSHLDNTFNKKISLMYSNENPVEIFVCNNLDGICLVGESINLLSDDSIKYFYELLLYCKNKLNEINN